MNFVNFFYFFILFYFSVTQKYVGHEFPKGLYVVLVQLTYYSVISWERVDIQI
jgi:hypothetical protein